MTKSACEIPTLFDLVDVCGTVVAEIGIHGASLVSDDDPTPGSPLAGVSVCSDDEPIQ